MFSGQGRIESNPMPRTLVIAAHPDDETIGAGALISSRSRHIQVVHATEGSPANPSDALAAGFSTGEDYATARKLETERALALARLPKTAILNLHFTDQQVCWCIEELSHLLLTLFEQYEPECVLTHSYEGGHPDHDSVALACHIARDLHAASRTDRKIELQEFTGYHASNGGMKTYDFLPHEGERVQMHRLAAEERELKIRMLREFTTQAKTLAPFMSPEFENFRRVPSYDFCRPPHEGKLFYENFDWGVDGVTWRRLASRALDRVRGLKVA
jgi:LmbE family N-acetylglucosaminyl deacetylase